MCSSDLLIALGVDCVAREIADLAADLADNVIEGALEGFARGEPA